MLDINSFSKKKMLDINCTSGTKCPCLWFIPTTLPLISLHSEMCTCLIEYVWNGERQREREIPPVTLPLSLLVLEKWKSCKDRNHMQRVCLKMREGKDKMAWRFGIYSKPPLYPFLKSYTLLKDCNNRNKPFVRIMSIY